MRRFTNIKALVTIAAVATVGALSGTAKATETCNGFVSNVQPGWNPGQAWWYAAVTDDTLYAAGEEAQGGNVVLAWTIFTYFYTNAPHGIAYNVTYNSPRGSWQIFHLGVSAYATNYGNGGLSTTQQLPLSVVRNAINIANSIGYYDNGAWVCINSLWNGGTYASAAACMNDYYPGFIDAQAYPGYSATCLLNGSPYTLPMFSGWDPRNPQ